MMDTEPTMCGLCYQSYKGHDPDTFVDYREVPEDEPKGRLNPCELVLLREQYLYEEPPRCPVCDAELSIAACGGGEPTRYACSKADPIKTGDWGHYRQSQWTDRKGDDDRVIRLLDEIEASRQKEQR